MTGIRNQITVKTGMDLKQISSTFEGDGNKIYAKKTKEGVLLYSKSDESFGSKFGLVLDGFSIKTKGAYKKALAEKTIHNLLFRDTTRAYHETGVKGFSLETRNRLDTLLNHVKAEPNFAKGVQLTGNQFSDAGGRISALRDRLQMLKDAKLAPRPQQQPRPFPNTNSKQLAGASMKSGLYEAPPIEVNGKRFEATKFLGAGGEGAVFLYKEKGVDPATATTFAVKYPVSDSKEKPHLEALEQKAIKEFEGAKTFVSDNPNLSGFTEIVKLDDGRVGLIGKPLPNGDFMGFASELKDVSLPRGFEGIPPKGKITAEERDLIVMTVIKDSANGLSALHNRIEGSAIHRDVKSANIMMDEKGRAVVMDLGELVEGQEYKPGVNGKIGNPRYVSPEAVSVVRQLDVLEGSFKSNNTKFISDEFRGILVKLIGEDKSKETKISNELSSVRSALTGELQSNLTARKEQVSNGTGTGLDIWGLGTAAFELLHGEMMANAFERNIGEAAKYTTVVSEYIADLPKNFDRMFTVGNQQKDDRTYFQGSGNADLDNLMNKILALNPDRRISASGLLDEPVLQNDKVGSQGVRDLMLAIKSGDPEKIQAARERLNA